MPPRAAPTRAEPISAAPPGAVRRRVVFINRYFYPDVSATSQMLSDLARRLAQHGVVVHVVCSRQRYDDPAAHLAANEVIDAVHVHRVWTSRFGRDRLLGRAVDYASFYVSSAVRLLWLLRAGDVVVAKTDPPLISIVALALARVRGCHLVNWLQDIFPEVAQHLGVNPLPRWMSRLLMQMRDRSLAMAHMNVVLGSRMREHLEGRRIPGNRICIIENWADEDSVAPKATHASALRDGLGIGDCFVVAYSGNLGRAHEFETILAAAEQIQGNDSVVFLMIGGGVKMDELRRASEGKALRNFRFLPYQPRATLADALAAGDVHLACLLPALEGLIVPSKFYGILAAGRPVVFIGDTQGELARVIDGAQCGAVVRLGNALGLVAVLNMLREQPQMRLAMGERARALFLQRYSVTRATRQWLELLHDMD